MITAQHPRQFGYLLFLLKQIDYGPGAAVFHPFFHLEMEISAGSDLRQMGNAHHLMMPCQFADLPGHGLGRLPADTCVDLIENHRIDLIPPGQQTFHCQHQP